MTNVIFAMDNYNVLTVETKYFSLHIANKVIDIWHAYRQVKSMEPEAFGVLVGNKDLEIESYGLVEITVPQKGDRCSRMSFSLRDPEHQNIVDHLHKSSQGQLVYFGTWHTHPEKIPTPHASILGTGNNAGYEILSRGFFYNNRNRKTCTLLFSK